MGSLSRGQKHIQKNPRGAGSSLRIIDPQEVSQVLTLFSGRCRPGERATHENSSNPQGGAKTGPEMGLFSQSDPELVLA